MAGLASMLEAPIPRPLLRVGVPAAALLLVVLFAFLRFPYDALAPALAQQLAAATGSEVSIGDIEPRITIAGPGLSARDVRIVTAARQRIDVDPLRIRPAWSTSWLGGDPAFRVDLASSLGRADAVVVLADAPAVRGEFSEIDLAALSQLAAAAAGGASLAGTLTGAADLSLGKTGPVGPLSFDATAGTIAHPLLPVAIDFEKVRADLVLGGGSAVEVRAFDLDGPVLHATVSGALLAAAPGGEPRLDLDVALELRNPLLRSLIEGVGVRFDPGGRASFAIAGTLAQPRFE